jgi:hypothetical protein
MHIKYYEGTHDNLAGIVTRLRGGRLKDSWFGSRQGEISYLRQRSETRHHAHVASCSVRTVGCRGN